MDEPVIKPHPLLTGSAGWCYTAIGVILWDSLVADDQQLTHAFRRGFKSRKILVGCSWMYLTGHLFGVLPPQYDLIHLIAAECGRRFDAYQDTLRQDRGFGA